MLVTTYKILLHIPDSALFGHEHAIDNMELIDEALGDAQIGAVLKTVAEAMIATRPTLSAFNPVVVLDIE